ncbi:hypothetical protein AMJ86_00080 [bacterium SM23_57]|jgi:membrane fusion protein (multidrug efflux system)|nr:MAG: hypothetical protein AMJ86_00080 [bacterium SM23_57]
MKIFLSFVTGFLLILNLSCSEDKADRLLPLLVTVYEIKPQEIPIYQEFIGQVYGIKDIAIRARVEGYLENIHFQEGSVVQKGQMLYSIESQPFEEAVAATMSRLAEAKTMLAKTESDLNRIRPLAAEKAVSQSDLDGAVAAYEAAQASVEAAEANLRASRINLSYTRVKSPITGIIGRTHARVGDFVGREPNPVILNTVSQVDTVRVQFFITENQYLAVARQSLQDMENLRHKTSDRDTNLELVLADGSLYKFKGAFDFIDRGIDPTTGAILIQASFPNPDGLIRPGQFAQIRVPMRDTGKTILVPQRSVMELQGKYQVYVVDDSNKVDLREVVRGPRYYNFWIIEDGLIDGEQVIYEGLQKVRPGITVKTEAGEVPIIKESM